MNWRCLRLHIRQSMEDIQVQKWYKRRIQIITTCDSQLTQPHLRSTWCAQGPADSIPVKATLLGKAFLVRRRRKIYATSFSRRLGSCLLLITSLLNFSFRCMEGNESCRK